LEVKLAVPSLFVAITRERIRWATSAARTMYVRRVASGIVVQLTPFAPPPLVSQRSQRYWNDIGCVPDHEPLVVKSALPSTAVP
jgi:hypothetical protein